MLQNKQTNHQFGLIIIACLFFIFGFITWANSQLIPYLKAACQLSETESYLVGTAFFAAYFFMSIPSSYLLKKVGFKKGMSFGLFAMGAGALLFIPAAMSRNYNLFLAGLFIIGSGLALLQTASNPYVTILGPLESAAQRISIMGICNKIAGIIAVYALGFLFLDNIDNFESTLSNLSVQDQQIALQALANKVIQPYLFIASAFIILGVILLFMNLPEVHEKDNEAEENKTTSIFAHKNLALGAIAIFFYVGAEVISYDAFSTLGVSLGFMKKEAATFASFTAYAMLIGYFLNIVLIPKFISQRKALIYSCILSIILVIVALNTSGYFAVFTFALLGLSQSAMWPAIWPLALDGLGKHTKMGSAILVMMIVGGAIMLPLLGKINAITASNHLGFYIMIPCYLYILCYAINGYQKAKK
jgi:FHS family L-fucose permease-like MFS transporter